jgi:hypothetical protein
VTPVMSHRTPLNISAVQKCACMSSFVSRHRWRGGRDFSETLQLCPCIELISLFFNCTVCFCCNTSWLLSNRSESYNAELFLETKENLESGDMSKCLGTSRGLPVSLLWYFVVIEWPGTF